MKRRFSIILVVAMIQLFLGQASFAAPIHDAVDAGNLAEVTRQITLNRANLKATNQHGDTPLHYAVQEGGQIAIVQALITHGADVGARNRDGVTPLHFAATIKCTEIVQALLSHGANPNVVTERGYTPLQLAAREGRTETVQALLAAGANANAAHKRGQTPLLFALGRQNNAATVAALQPEAIAQLHTQTGDAHTTAGNHRLAARSHTWAAESYTQHAHAQVAAGDYVSAIQAHQSAQANHTASGNHEAARLSHHLTTLLAPAVPAQDHLASASGHAQTMETHFETAVIKAGEMKFHLTRGDETAAALAEAQLQENLESADRSEAEAISAFEAALVALDDAMRAHTDAQVADAPAEPTQNADTVDSLRTHTANVSSKIDETRANAEAGRERVSSARGL